MKRIQATAPGKIILFGEHAVVYSRPAIAVPVSKVRAQPVLETTAPGSGLRITAPDLDRDYLLAEARAGDPLAATIEIALNHLGQADVPDAVLSVTSSIPLGRGLGSGSAISTAIIRALGHHFSRIFSPAEVSSLVFEVEKLYHGTPSGLDNTVVSFEQPVFFIKGEPMARMVVNQPFTVIIGDTGRVTATRDVVGDLRGRWQVDQERYEGYFDEIEVIVRQAKVNIEQGVPGISALGKLMNENQDVLRTLGVSSVELERLIAAARQAGAVGAKLSGAGWGGNMIALVPAQPELIVRVTGALKNAGAAGVIVTEVN
jgi:mevalonate kinase